MLKNSSHDVDKTNEALRRQRLLEQHNRAYAAVRADTELWRKELEERAIWDAALADGLEDEDCMTP
jgi:hypothetical protein